MQPFNTSCKSPSFIFEKDEWMWGDVTRSSELPISCVSFNYNSFNLNALWHFDKHCHKMIKVSNNIELSFISGHFRLNEKINCTKLKLIWIERPHRTIKTITDSYSCNIHESILEETKNTMHFRWLYFVYYLSILLVAVNSWKTEKVCIESLL